MKKVLIRQEKLTVDGIWKEQGFRLEDEVIEDSMEQIEQFYSTKCFLLEGCNLYIVLF